MRKHERKRRTKFPRIHMDEPNIKISVVLCTYNEETYLDECLKSITFADEIVVCDMGSADRSVEIATRNGCTVHSINKVPYVELVREKAITFCKNDWICFIDPDWIFVGDLQSYMSRKSTSDTSITCFALTVVNHYRGIPVWHGRWSPMRYPCLFQRKSMKLIPILHNGFQLIHGRQVVAPRSIFFRHMWMKDAQHFHDKAMRYIVEEGTRRVSLGYRPSATRTIRLVIQMIRLYIFGGIWDGKMGYELFKKSIWYELESEKQLKIAYISSKKHS